VSWWGFSFFSIQPVEYSLGLFHLEVYLVLLLFSVYIVLCFYPPWILLFYFRNCVFSRLPEK
jgi:hypothetical protein